VHERQYIEQNETISMKAQKDCCKKAAAGTATLGMPRKEA